MYTKCRVYALTIICIQSVVYKVYALTIICIQSVECTH